MPPSDAGVLESWKPRFSQFEEDGGKGTLGPQRNADSTSTRTKVTHVDILGLGLVGSVSSVAYGSWLGETAMLLVMQFDFRAKEGLLRFRRAEISITFDTQTKPELSQKQLQPAVRKILPIDNRTHGPAGPSLGSEWTSKSPPVDLLWPSGEYTVKGRDWREEDKEEPNVIFWKVYEIKGSKFGICDSIRVAAVVACSVPFKATVDVEATTLGFIKVRNFPWSRDDPLLFDGATSRGLPLPSSSLSELDTATLIKYISEARSSSSLPSLGETMVPADSSHSDVPTQQKSGSVKVYRVRGVPRSHNKDAFVQVLSTAIGVHENSIHVYTFAPNPYRPEAMAIVSFDSEVKELSGKTDKNEWTVCINQETKREDSLASTYTLLFDTHFLGFSSLGRGLLAKPHQVHVDIIAVHGLGGHAYGTFKERGGTYMWLEDSLSTDLFSHGSSAATISRVLVYGYDTRIEKSPSFQSIRDLARKLRVSLRAIREDNVCHRPLIFIGHSLGGLLIKELFIILGDPDADQEDQANLKATLGALFFGVPNRGMDNTALLSIIKEQPNVEFLNSLSIGSTFLQNQAETFPTVFDRRDSIIFSFYETCVSGTAMMEKGKLTMNGTPVVLVNEESATHSRPWETGARFVIPVDRGHSELVKFERFSNEYESVLTCIRELLRIQGSRLPTT